METLKVKGEEKEIIFTASKLAKIEKELGFKPIDFLYSKIELEEGKEVKKWYYNATLSDVEIVIRNVLELQESAYSIIDENGGNSYYPVIQKCVEAYTKLVTIAKSGNLEAPIQI